MFSIFHFISLIEYWRENLFWFLIIGNCYNLNSFKIINGSQLHDVYLENIQTVTGQSIKLYDGCSNIALCLPSNVPKTFKREAFSGVDGIVVNLPNYEDMIIMIH